MSEPKTDPKNPEDALRAEAAPDSATAEFEFRGEKFTFPRDYADQPLDFIEAVADLLPLAIQARALLGPDQWERVRAMRLKGSDFDEMSDAIQSAMGISSGNSTASSD